MGIIQRQAIKGSIVNYIGVLLGFFTTVYFLPAFFTEEQVGVYRFVLDTGLLIGGLASLGMPNIILKFFPYLKDNKTNHNGFALYMFLIPFLGFIIYSILILSFDDLIIQYFSRKTRGYEQYFTLILPIALIFALFLTFEIFSSVNNRIVVPKLIKEIIIKILIIMLLYLFFIDFLSFGSVINLLPLIYFIGLIVLLVYLRILGNKIFPFRDFKLIPRNIAKQMFSFGALIFLSAVGTGLLTKIDMFVISSELGFAATGVYTTAFYIAIMVEIPSRSLYQIVMPAITTAFKDNDIKTIEGIYKKTAQNLLIISGVLFLLLVVNLDNIFYLFPKGDIYSKGKYVVIFIALAKFIDNSIGINFHILGYSKYYFYTLPLLIITGMLNIFLNYWFIGMWGMTGAAIATLMVLLFNNILVLLIIYSKYKIQPFQIKNIYPLLTLLTVFIVSNYLINFSNVYLSIFFKSAFIVACVGFFTIKYKFSEDISSIYNKYLLFVKNILPFK